MFDERPESLIDQRICSTGTGVDRGDRTLLPVSGRSGARRLAAIESSVTTGQVAERLCLPLPLVEQLLQHLYREKFLEARGRSASAPTATRCSIEAGISCVALTEISGYVGPAPVSLNAYSALMRSQAQPEEKVGSDQVERPSRTWFCPRACSRHSGFAINSRRSLFISGIPGTGKTSIAERVNYALQAPIWIPYAIAIDEHVISIFDAHNHDRTYDEEIFPGVRQALGANCAPA
jgi:hypothetical protein